MTFRRLAAPLLLLAAAAALWFAVRPSGDFPVNDEWTYAAPVRTLLSEGRLRLCDHASVPDLPPVLLAAAVCRLAGFGYGRLRFCALLWGLLGVIFLDGMLKDAGLPPGRRALACMALFFNPVCFYLDFTFHTDGPALSLLLGAVFFFLRAERSGRGAHELASGLFGTMAALTRPTAGVFFLGAAAWDLLRGRRAPGRWARLFVPAALIGGAFLAWFWFIHGPTWTVKGLLSTESVANPLARPLTSLLWTADALLYAALFASPLAFVREEGDRSRGLFPAAAGAAAYALCRGKLPTLINVLNTRGLGPLSGAEAQFWKPAALWSSPWTWLALTLLACWSLGVFISRAAARPWRAEESAPALLAFPPAFSFLSRAVFFDRYLSCPLAGLIPAAALRPARGRVTRFAWLLAGFWVFFSVAGLRDYFAWNRAKWALGQKALAMGYKPWEVANGLDWAAHFYYEPAMEALKRRKPLERIGEMEWKKVPFPKVFVTFDPSLYPPDHLLAVQRYSSPLAGERGALFLFKSS